MQKSNDSDRMVLTVQEIDEVPPENILEANIFNRIQVGFAGALSPAPWLDSKF